MKIISYNVLDGFTDSETRKTRCATWLKKQSPDIVTFNELNKFTHDTLSTFAATWNHKYSLLFQGKSDYHLGITSNKPIDPILLSDNMLQGHGLMHIKTHDFNILTTHLNPHSSSRRRHDTKAIISCLLRIMDQKESYILTGDLNSFHPNDKEYYNGPSSDLVLFQQNPTIEKASNENLVDGQLDYQVSIALEGIGAVDLLSTHQDKFQYTLGNRLYQQKLISNGSELLNGLDPRKIQGRIDYIWADKDLAQHCSKCYVDQAQDTNDLSDHNPIIAEFYT